MTNNDRKEHWENIYALKQPNEVSWTQQVPETSLQFINSCGLPKDASIIDIGGGDSRLVDFLLSDGYTNITVLDISENALQRARKRLGDKATQVNWIVSDVLEFEPEHNYDIWHDRAAFHFFTDDNEIQKYIQLISRYVNSDLIIGTFSDRGPLKCSGLHIKQYSPESMLQLMSEHFKSVDCITIDHVTPFDTTQNFLFCHYKKK